MMRRGYSMRCVCMCGLLCRLLGVCWSRVLWGASLDGWLRCLGLQMLQVPLGSRRMLLLGIAWLLLRCRWWRVNLRRLGF